jgi:hypothetical protein
MSFLSGLLKVGGAIAAPFTGGASLGLSALGGIGDIAGKAAGGAASGREREAQLLMQQDQLRNSQFGTQQGAEMQAGNLDLNRKNFEEGARGGRAKQALLASLLGGGFQPTSIDVPGIKKSTMTGGLAESLKSPGAQQAMQELMRQALAAQMQQGSPQGEQFTGGAMLKPPTLNAMPKAGMLEKILGGVGVGGSILGSLAGRGGK